jgi:hypothetical protein
MSGRAATVPVANQESSRYLSTTMRLNLESSDRAGIEDNR